MKTETIALGQLCLRCKKWVPSRKNQCECGQRLEDVYVDLVELCVEILKTRGLQHPTPADAVSAVEIAQVCLETPHVSPVAACEMGVDATIRGLVRDDSFEIGHLSPIRSLPFETVLELTRGGDPIPDCPQCVTNKPRIEGGMRASYALAKAIKMLDELQIIPPDSELNDLEWENLTPKERIAQWRSDLVAEAKSHRK